MQVAHDRFHFHPTENFLITDVADCAREESLVLSVNLFHWVLLSSLLYSPSREHQAVQAKAARTLMQRLVAHPV